MDFGERAPGEQADFDGANQLGAIARPDARGGLGIQTPQHAMQVLQAVRVGARFQARAQFFRARRGIGQSFQQRAQIKPRADGKNREPRALAQVFQNGDGSQTIFPRREREMPGPPDPAGDAEHPARSSSVGLAVPMSKPR